MNGELRLASRRQMFRSLLGLSVGERLLSSPRELSEHDITEAIKYGRSGATATTSWSMALSHTATGSQTSATCE